MRKMVHRPDLAYTYDLFATVNLDTDDDIYDNGQTVEHYNVLANLEFGSPSDWSVVWAKWRMTLEPSGGAPLAWNKIPKEIQDAALARSADE